MWEIDGVLLPTDEIDGCCMHAVLAYREMGLSAPTGDLYVVDGYPRRLCKLAFQIMLNAANNPDANGSIARGLYANEKGIRDGTPLTEDCTLRECKKYVWGLMRAIKARHPSVKPMFCSGAGLTFPATGIGLG